MNFCINSSPNTLKFTITKYSIPLNIFDIQIKALFL